MDAAVGAPSPRTPEPVGPAGGGAQTLPQGHRRVLFAASAGTLFEWYDFYLFGVLAPVLALHFFSGLSAGLATISVWLTFAAGFLARPIGAVLFGNAGDKDGRKNAFLVTLVVMALCTANVALLPTYADWGWTATFCLLLQRLVQGLALGGEYGGAVTYVIECAPSARRGQVTAWLQTTALGGLMLALLVTGGVRWLLGEDAFAEWGWRVPYALSAAMLLASIWFRRRLHESPLFRQMQQQGRTEVHPVRTLLAHPLHRRRLVLAVLGLTAGQAVIWYTAYFQAHAFVQGPLGVSSLHATGLAVVAIAASLPLTVIAGRWSDKVGRRRPIILGLVLGAVMCGPVFHGLQRLLQPVVVVTVMESNHPHCKRWTPPGRNAACDELRSAWLARGLQVDWQPVHDNGAPVLRLRIGDQIMHSDDPADLHAKISNLDAWLVDHHRGPPPDVTVGSREWWWAAALLTALGGCAALVYGPLAAALAELFPTPVRYTGTSLSYHLGNGLFGGVLPVTSHLLVMLVGHPLAGLVYPVAIALLSAGLAWLWLPEGRDVDISR